MVEEEDEEESEANGMESRSARRPRLRGGGSAHRRARPVRTHRPHGRFLIDGQTVIIIIIIIISIFIS